jgi:hypothetical protein
MPLFIPQPQRLLEPPILLPELQLEIASVKMTIKEINKSFCFTIRKWITNLRYFVFKIITTFKQYYYQ